MVYRFSGVFVWFALMASALAQTGNPSLLRDIFVGKTGAMPRNFAPLGTDVVFTTDEPLRQSLWRSDGSTTGTTLIRSFPKATPAADPSLLHAVGGVVVFRLHQADIGTELWSTDGTAAGTAILRDFTAGAASTEFREFQLVNGELFFHAGNQLWKTTGTAGSTTLVRDLGAQDGVSYIGSLAEYNGKLYFSASNAAAGQELWVSDGTSDGTVILKDIAPGSLSSGPRQLVSSANGLFFFAFVYPDGDQLWRSDGTPGGTVVVDSIKKGFYSSFPANLTVTGNAIYFTANDGVNGVELWKSAGTADSTAVLKHIAPGKAGSSPADLTALGNTLYFSSDDVTNGRQLWKTDGTAAGTAIVKKLYTLTSGANPSQLRVVGSKLWFAASDSHHGAELWQTDGTAEGTLLMADIQRGSAGSFPQGLFANASHLFFSASTTGHGRELWAFDHASGDPVHVVQFERTEMSQIEDEKTLRVPVTLTLATGTAFDLPFTVSGTAVTADAALTQSPLKFGAGQTSANIIITLKDDVVAEGAETIVIQLGTPTLAAVSVGARSLFTLTIEEDDVAPALNPPLANVIVARGDPLTLSSSLTGSAPIKVTWTKGTSRIAGAVTPQISFTPVELADAGNYTLRASNQASAVSTSCKVAVVDRTPSLVRADPGQKVTLRVVAAGTGLSYRWRKDGADLPTNDLRYGGVAGSQLIIKAAQSNDAGAYTCRVTAPGGDVESGLVSLHIASEPPVLLPFDLPQVVVGNDYLFAIPLDATPEKAPTRFRCTGLPPGLVCNPVTGVISGRTTVQGDFTVSAMASNSAGDSPLITDSLLVTGFPQNTVGRWVALIQREQDAKAQLGGMIHLTVSASGGCTASGMLGWQRFRFTESLDTAAVTAAASLLTKTITLAGGKQVELSLSLDPTTSELQGHAKHVGSAHQAAVVGWRSATGNILPGRHAFSMTPAASGPQGHGFTRVSVSQTTSVVFSGRTPSGGAFTSSTFLSPLNEACLYAPVRMEQTSVLGTILVASGVDSTINWQKIADTGLRFPVPFGPVDLIVRGGPYGITTPVLSLPDTTSGVMNARLVFEATGWPSHIPTAVQCRISKTHGMTISATNAANVRIDRFDPASGVISGIVALVEAGYETRTGYFTIQLVPALGKGQGYILLPQLADPAANPPTTEATSPILAGKVVLEALTP
jgi:ELWxxDGT repeat protein